MIFFLLELRNKILSHCQLLCNAKYILLIRLKNEELFRRYEKITRGKVKDPADEIEQEYNAKFVLTDNQHQDFMKKVGSSKRFRKRYSDTFTTIYEIVPSENAMLTHLTN